MDESRIETAERDMRFIDTGGAFSFFDAIFAVAMTLLVLTVTPPLDAWKSFSDLWNAAGQQLEAFVLSFVIIGAYWWSNRKFLGRLRGISPQIVFGNLAMLLFVVVLPVSTNALGDPVSGTGRVTTVVYAINIAAISTMALVLFLIAQRQRLFDPALSRRAVRAEIIDGLAAPIVFLLSIPMTLVLKPLAGQLTWATMLVVGPWLGAWSAKQRELVD